MDMVKLLGVVVTVLKLLVKLLQWGVVKIEWDLPGHPLLWAKLGQAREDKKITSSEIIALIEEAKKETPDWADWALDVLVWVIGVVKPIEWDLTGKYGAFWDSVFAKLEDDKLTHKEIGDILDTVLNWATA